MSDAEFSDSDIETGDALLPLDAWHRARGGRMVSFAGYAMPIQYEGIMVEHCWTREHAGLFDVSHMGQLLFSGEGADRALEALLPGDIVGLKEGAATGCGWRHIGRPDGHAPHRRALHGRQWRDQI
jgi:aminomethyltransferase